MGPGKVLANLVSKILQDRPHLALISNQADRPGLSQLQQLLGQFIVHGGQVNREKLYQGRALRPIDLDALYRETNRYGVTATTWLVNGARAIPFTEAMTAAPKNTVKPMEVTSDMTTIKHEGSAAEYPGSATSGMSAAAPPVTSKEYVMVQHQKLMQRLLDMHQSVMTSYMNGLAAGSTTLLPAQAVAAREAALPVDATTGTVPQAALPAAPKPAGDSLPKSDPGDNGGMPADRQTKAALLRIVSERTGYPEDMLDLDLNLEADLGIDSIKRVEILTRLTEVMFPNGHEESLEQIEEINLSKTLREIMGHIEKFMAAAGKSGSAEAPAPLPEKTAAGAARYDENLLLPRFTLTAVDAPIQDSAFALAQDRVTIITDDEGGIARSLQEKLTATGYPAVILRWGKGRAQSEEPVYFLNNLAAEEITTVVQSIRQQHGRVGGLIHLFPLKKGPSFADIDLPGWTARLDYEVTSLFLLLKHLEPDLRQAAQNGGAVVMSAVDMGGTFASGVNTNNNNFFPGHGGISGLLKTAAIEMPPVRVKSIDLDPAESAADIAEKLFTEIGVADHCLEIGYAGKKRMRLDLVAAALQSRQDNGLRMDSSWVILMTGGARGITAQIALDLARKYQPKLILAGRSLPPSAAESAATAGVEQPEALKKIIIDTMRQQGENFSLVDVENEYRRLRREREMRSNIAAMRRAGSEVEYCQVDVRDEEAFGGLIDDIYERHGNIHAVIHGAGVIEDKLIKDKTLASFDRVLGTKTQSAFILSKKLRPESLKLLVLFSSVAGRFGNQGQCDYAAANEVMNKLAVYLNKRWPGRVVSINWGPWDQSGMVSDGLRQEFARRGVRLIPPAAGSLFM
ncbi:MAG: SDR family NAD(P)-dependent oxidoreductase, partial [Desulfosudaceae bacterium]